MRLNYRDKDLMFSVDIPKKKEVIKEKIDEYIGFFQALLHFGIASVYLEENFDSMKKDFGELIDKYMEKIEAKIKGGEK